MKGDGRGGRRPGAGRPVGTKNRETAIDKVEEYLALEGLPGPLEFLLEVMSGRDPRGKEAQIELDRSIDAAKTLMRYVYPQISSVTTEVTTGGALPQLVVSGREFESIRKSTVQKLVRAGIALPESFMLKAPKNSNIIQ